MKNNFFKIFTIILTGFILYIPSLFFNFTYFDDQVLILENLSFLRDLNNIGQVFKRDVFFSSLSPFYYRPVLTLSLMFDAQLSGQSPFFYHLANVLYHAVASVLLVIFLKKLKIEEKISFLLTLIFVVHPVLTQAVSWIPGRNDSLLTIFTLSSFIFLIDYLEKKSSGSFLLYFIFFALALFTKESAILIPFFSILFVGLFYRKKKNYLIELFFGWWIVFLFWFILRQRAINNILYLSFPEIVKALIFNSPALLQYLGKIFFPFNLSVLPTIKDTSFFWGGLAVLFLIPNFVQPNTSITADFLEHRIYLPLVGFLISLVSVEKIRNFLSQEANKIFIFLLILVFSLITFFHQFKFKDRLIFWQNAVKSSPNSPLAHRNYGAMLYFEGKLERAEEEYKKSLKLNPKEPMAHNNLGVIYMNQKKVAKGN